MHVLKERYVKKCAKDICGSELYTLVVSQAAQSYPVLLITLYLYINSILKIIRKSCVINLLRYIFI